METNKTGSLKKVGHAAALMFGAYWLVATSAVAGPPRDCFTGIDDPATLRIVLGESAAAPAEGRPPSCAGADGLMPGAVLTLTVARTATETPNGQCRRLDTRAIGGVQDVTLSQDKPLVLRETFAAPTGRFVSSRFAGCQADWYLVLAPASLGDSEVISPLDAGAKRRWLVSRQLWATSAGICDGAFHGEGGIECEDEFVVDGITEVAP